MKYLTVVLLLVATSNGNEHLVTVRKLNQIADFINENPASTWQASKFHASTNDEVLNTIYHTGVPAGDTPPQLVGEADEKASNCENNGLPRQFDAREHWPECASVIGHIYDQGNCGSCWAVSSASVFSDRVCIASNGKHQSLFSVQQILSCCGTCISNRNACLGGWPMWVFRYIKRKGLTTGGDYESKQGCQPYLLKHCEHHRNGTYPLCSSLKETVIPKCKSYCYNHRHDKTFKQDKIKAKKYYEVAPCAAMNEIYRNGPIVANFPIFEDFYTYKSGVYQYYSGKKTGYHAVRVIGWGEENGEHYWLAANSWNSHWGDQGFFKIRRGSDEVWFEENMAAVIPDYKEFTK